MLKNIASRLGSLWAQCEPSEISELRAVDVARALFPEISWSRAERIHGLRWLRIVIPSGTDKTIAIVTNDGGDLFYCVKRCNLKELLVQKNPETGGQNVLSQEEPNA